MQTKTAFLADPLAASWTRLKRGRVALQPHVLEATKTVLLLLLTEAVDAQAACERRSEAVGSTHAAGQARYWANVRGFIGAAYKRLSNNFHGHDVERMLKLSREVGDDCGT